MTGFCTTIDEISCHIRELVTRGIFARNEIEDIATHVCQKYGITLGTAMWIARHVVARKFGREGSVSGPSSAGRTSNPVTLLTEA